MILIVLIAILAVPLLIAFDLAVNTDILIDGLHFILTIIFWLVNLILSPVNDLIEEYLPAIANGAESVASMFDIAMTYMHWLLNAIPIPTVALTLIVSYYLFTFTISFGMWSIKLLFKWKKAAS